jgi:hypothetical protein
MHETKKPTQLIDPMNTENQSEIYDVTFAGELSPWRRIVAAFRQLTTQKGKNDQDAMKRGKSFDDSE